MKQAAIKGQTIGKAKYSVSTAERCQCTFSKEARLESRELYAPRGQVACKTSRKPTPAPAVGSEN